MPDRNDAALANFLPPLQLDPEQIAAAMADAGLGVHNFDLSAAAEAIVRALGPRLLALRPEREEARLRAILREAAEEAHLFGPRGDHHGYFDDCSAEPCRKRRALAAAATLTPSRCADPEHPGGAWCANTTGLDRCHDPAANRGETTPSRSEAVAAELAAYEHVHPNHPGPWEHQHGGWHQHVAFGPEREEAGLRKADPDVSVIHDFRAHLPPALVADFDAAVWRVHDRLRAALAAPVAGLDAALVEVGRVAVGIVNDWMGDPDHGFILDPLVGPVEAWRARLTADRTPETP